MTGHKIELAIAIDAKMPFEVNFLKRAPEVIVGFDEQQTYYIEGFSHNNTLSGDEGV